MYTYRFKRRQIDVDSATTGLHHRHRYSFARLINGLDRIAVGWSGVVEDDGYPGQGAKKNRNNRDFGL